MIESERSQIKHIFEIEFAKNTKEVEQFLDAKTRMVIKGQKTIKVCIGILGGITMLLCALISYKVWMW